MSDFLRTFHSFQVKLQGLRHLLRVERLRLLFSRPLDVGSQRLAEGAGCQGRGRRGSGARHGRRLGLGFR